MIRRFQPRISLEGSESSFAVPPHASEGFRLLPARRRRGWKHGRLVRTGIYRMFAEQNPNSNPQGPTVVYSFESGDSCPAACLAERTESAAVNTDLMNGPP